jgi:uroporphyrinogen-III synthase
MNQVNLRILITGEHDNIPAGRLPGGNVEWTSFPVLDFERLPIPEKVAKLVVEKPFDWILFASPRVVTFWNEFLLEQGFENPIETQVACIGESTAEKASLDGYTPDFYPTEPGSEKFLEEFESLIATNAQKPSILIPMAEGGRKLLCERLREWGCEVTVVALYRTIPKSDISTRILEIPLGEFAAVVYTSPSSYDALSNAVPLPDHLKIGAIGQFTSAHLNECGVQHRTLPGGDLSRVAEIL